VAEAAFSFVPIPKVPAPAGRSSHSRYQTVYVHLVVALGAMLSRILSSDGTSRDGTAKACNACRGRMLSRC
jgi:hypothetical protein